MALLKENIGSSYFKRNSGILSRSTSRPTQRKDFFFLISEIKFSVVIANISEG